MNYTRVAARIAKLLQKGEKNNLISVIIKGEGVGYYYNLATESFIPVPKRSEMYYLPLKKDENEQLYIFLPYTFAQGAVILVPEEDVEFLGYN